MSLFDDEYEGCPALEEGECSFQMNVHFNGHVNDPRHSWKDCEEWSCPIYFWLEKFAERIKVNGSIE